MDTQLSSASPVVASTQARGSSSGWPEARTLPPGLYTNQQVINAFYHAADRLGYKEGALLKKVGFDLNKLAADRLAPYRGPEIERLEGLNTVERVLIKQELRDQQLEKGNGTGHVDAPDGPHLQTGPADRHQSIDQAGGKPLLETDPALYSAWRSHMQRGFANNTIMFDSVLQGFMTPYNTTIWMYRILFMIGVAAFGTACLLAYLFREAPAVAAGTSAVFGGLSVVSFLAFFVSHPLRALERNLHFIAWLGIVYNRYWARLAYLQDPKTFSQEVESVTEVTVREIERMIDKRASLK